MKHFSSGFWGYVFTLLFAVAHSQAQNLPAFPGAEGYGSITAGGRGGRVIRVTNLNDSGPGSFRAALDEAPAFPNEPRIIIFDVCGIINGKYSSTLNVRYPYCTIAGQSAPGNGICLEGAELSIGTHDVVIRGMRFRPGDAGSPTGNNYDGPDGIRVSNSLGLGDIYNVIIDHCSISWAIDENASIWESSTKNGQIYDVTYQWNIISEALHCTGIHIENGEVQCHGMGLLVGDRVENVSVHHNLFAHNSARSALIQSGTKTEFINNVIYNWKDQSTSVSNSNGVNLPSFADLIGNYYQPGKNYKHYTSPNPEMKSYWEINIGTSLHSDSRVYISGNKGRNLTGSDNNQWAKVYGDSVKYKSETRVAAFQEIPVSIETADNAKTQVLKGAGAIAQRRDFTDKRIVQGFYDGTGEIPNHLYEIGGYPAYASNCDISVDSDQDGMPDYFEEANGLDKKVNDANEKTLSLKATGVQGYTNIEVCLNGLIEKAWQENILSSAVSPDQNNKRLKVYQTENILKIDGVGRIREVGIYNLNGSRRVFKNDLYSAGMTLNKGTMLSGIYVLSVKTDEGVYVKKIRINQL